MACPKLQFNQYFKFIEPENTPQNDFRFVGNDRVESIPSVHQNEFKFIKEEFNGEQFDPNLQMQYLRARYYDQSNGRFNRLDPFTGNNYDPQSLHKYAYTHCNPVMGIDPSGMFFTLIVTLCATAIRFTLRTIKLASTVLAKNKIEISLSSLKGLLIGITNAFGNSYLSGKSKIPNWLAFSIGFIAGFTSQMVAFKFPNSPRAPAIIENLMINFLSELFDDSDMTWGKFVWYIGESVFWGEVANIFNKYLPADAAKDKLIKFFTETDTGFVASVIRGYRRYALNW